MLDTLTAFVTALSFGAAVFHTILAIKSERERLLFPAVLALLMTTAGVFMLLSR